MKVEQKPVHVVKLRGNISLWPVVIIEKAGKNLGFMLGLAEYSLQKQLPLRE